MEPSEVRERILSEHRTLRQKLGELELTVQGVLRGEVSAADLRIRGTAVCERLLAHLELEDQILVPTLREVDPWGDVRADEISRHHAMQREEFESILGALTDEGSELESLGGRLLALIGELRQDMDLEDASVLHPNLLRDDCIGIDVSSG